MWNKCKLCKNLNPENVKVCTNCGAVLFKPEPIIIKKKEKELDEKSKARVDDFIADLKDDGKRNYSNRKPKSMKEKSSKASGKLKSRKEKNKR